MQIPSFSGQVARNTTGYKDPFATAINSGLPKPAPLVSPFAGQMARNQAEPKPYTAPASPGAAATPKAPAASPAAAPSAPGASAPAPAADGGAGGGGAYDLSTDPIVQKIRALNTTNYGQAVAGAQASAKQDLIDSGWSFGDAINQNPDLAASIGSSPIGSVLTDEATNLAAQKNPYSTRAGLALAHSGNVNAVDQNENAQNLYYSSDRANKLGDEAHSYLGSVAGAQGSLAQQLAALLTGLTTEKGTEQRGEADALEQARQNAITNAISGGQVMLGYDANGNPIFGSAPGAAGTTGGAAGGGPAPVAPLAPPGAPPRAAQVAKNTTRYKEPTPSPVTRALAAAKPRANAAQVKKNS